ncbi:MAG: FixH family protein [Bacteroidota bacterium]
MNWGKGIAIWLGAFIIFILVLAIKLMTTNVDLVTPDYYQREINYSQEMEAVQNSEDLDERIALVLIEDYLAVKIPMDFNAKNIELRLIRNNDQELDKNFKIENTNTFLIAKNQLVKGLYDTELYYTINGEKYMQKEKIKF